MEPSSPKPSPGAGKPAKEKATDNIRLEPNANRNLTASARKLNISKTKYASAAIAFFADSGLDPTVERPAGLAAVNATVAEETRRVRKQGVDIGNRFISIMRAWEANSYAFHQQQQIALTSYLEVIESNLMRQLVAIETNLLEAMVEQLFRVNTEASTTRGLTQLLMLLAQKKPLTEFRAESEEAETKRDAKITRLLREFATTNAVPRPKLTTKPAVTPIPKVVSPPPIKPAVPGAAAPVPGAAAKP